MGYNRIMKRKREEQRMRDRGRYLMGAACAGTALVLLAAARKVPGFADWYTDRIYPVLVAVWGGIWGIFPFSVSEIGLYLVLLASAAGLVRCRKCLNTFLSGGVMLAGVLLLLYSANCGVNYYSTPFSQYLPYEREEYTEEELERLLIYLTEQVNRYRDQAGTQLTAEEYGKEGMTAMKALGEIYPCLSGFYPCPKYLTVPWILSVQQLAGVYSPFTAEANYNNAMVPYNIPHTICHELSHLKGFMREDEANFIGFLACLESERAEFRYSGYLMGWIYAGNALAKSDPVRYGEIRQQLDDGVKADLEANTEFWDRYEGKAAKTAEAVNDAYLKLNDQERGVKSYGMAVDLMLGWAADQGIH